MAKPTTYGHKKSKSSPHAILALPEAQQRALVVAEARRWLGTPYHHRAALLDIGIDCAQLLLQAFAGCGLIDHFEPDVYTCDWHLHRGEEKYLSVVESYAPCITGDDERCLKDRGKDYSLQPGDIMLWRVGRTLSHSAIVTEWPFIIHSYLPAMIVEEVDVTNTPMSIRPMRAFSYWIKQ